MTEVKAKVQSPHDDMVDSYDMGYTAMFAAKSDPRFHYCLYVPKAVAEGTQVDLLVAMHGSSRTSFLEFRDGFAEFGRWNNCAILCPIFPIGVRGDGARHGYKYIKEEDIRYDNVLLSIVDEVSKRYRQKWDKFALFGFSGGGHFTHRFAILHPDKLWAASIGGAGSVTLLDTSRNWWVGIKDLKQRFGIEFNAAAFSKLPIHIIVGEVDLETWEITHAPGSKFWMEGANDAGRTRPERLKALKASFEAVGAKVRFDLLAGVSHDRAKTLVHVQDFLASVQKQRRAAG